MANRQLDQFTSRWALLVSMIGIAIGTGNIWRFPRIAAKYEGSAFLIARVVFLFLWSIPIILLGALVRPGAAGSQAMQQRPKQPESRVRHS